MRNCFRILVSMSLLTVRCSRPEPDADDDPERAAGVGLQHPRQGAAAGAEGSSVGSRLRAVRRSTRRRPLPATRILPTGSPTNIRRRRSSVKGPMPNACGSCHLMSGQGHPESADIAGMPAEYILRQMNYFKSGARKEEARMGPIARAVSDEDVRQAAEYLQRSSRMCS